VTHPSAPSGRTPFAPARFAGAVFALVLVAAFVIVVVVSVPGEDPQGPVRAILQAEIVDGPLPIAIWALAALAVVVIAARRWHRRALLAAGIAAAGAAVLGVVLLILANTQDWFGVTLDAGTWAWSIGTFAAIGFAAGSFVDAPLWRRFVAASAVILVALAGTVGVNADFGIQPTVASFAGVSLTKKIDIPVAAAPAPAPSASASAKPLLADGALWANWHAPADMPAKGATGTVDIPNTVSGFVARPAGLYLPPAALTKDAPLLPLVVMMMGQPGDPDPGWQEEALDPFAARHDGLAPIVIVADQTRDHNTDPMCVNSAKYGNAATYITQDVLPWARAHLRVLQDPAHTVVAGYSNGGECAVSLGARYPDLWTNVLDISGELYPGSDHPAQAVKDLFGGNQAAYQATWPQNILASGHYPDTVGVFTVGSPDGAYTDQAKQMVAFASAAGWSTSYVELPGAGHGATALRGGLVNGYSQLYPRLGLSEPGKPS
jgi:poly(3-hydroxybutyrate) depolymerase